MDYISEDLPPYTTAQRPYREHPHISNQMVSLNGKSLPPMCKTTLSLPIKEPDTQSRTNNRSLIIKAI